MFERLECIRNPVIRTASVAGAYAATLLACGGLSAYGFQLVVGSITVKILPNDNASTTTTRLSFPIAAALVLSTEESLDRLTFPTAASLVPLYADAKPEAESAAPALVDREAITLAAIASGENESASPWSSGSARTYRTMCVRLCDGSFFPVSFATVPEFFENDDALCRKNCAAPARLYVFKNPGETPAAMKNLDGEPYAKLKTAYSFRATYNPNCTCKGQPWEQAARDRHRLYALRDAETIGEADEIRKVELARLETEFDLRQSEIDASEPLVETAVASRAIEEPKPERVTRLANRVRVRVRARPAPPPRRAVRLAGMMRLGVGRPRADGGGSGRSKRYYFRPRARGVSVGEFIRRSIGGF